MPVAARAQFPRNLTSRASRAAGFGAKPASSQAVYSDTLSLSTRRSGPAKGDPRSSSLLGSELAGSFCYGRGCLRTHMQTQTAISSIQLTSLFVPFSETRQGASLTKQKVKRITSTRARLHSFSPNDK